MSFPIKKILIANRGEIACRIIRTCREMGIGVVTIYTDEEAGLPHVVLADEAVCMGSGPLSDTYLNAPLIVDIAKRHHVQAIHPGYGFLSERPHFVRAVQQAGLVFIGPSAEVMELMGDKMGSKQRLSAIKTPLIPGYHEENQSMEILRKEMKKIGMPVLIKASAGGGGKGMRLVEREEDFDNLLESAKREAKKAFGDDRVLLEKYLKGPRHVEIQVFGDQHGNCVYLFERECSIQRRHQKIIEETPSPALNPGLRRRMGEAAVDICRLVKYCGAGTVEFMLDEDLNFYFLEMNTRLQVEHPITEMTTGQDLVRWQLMVAAGMPLPLTQASLHQQGHSIEMRLYAENPDHEFLPTTGTLHWQGRVRGPGVRLESGLADGQKVGISFDPMLAKLVVHAQDRASAIERALQALRDVPMLGLQSNHHFLTTILKSQAFASGKTYTHFIQTHHAELFARPSDEELAVEMQLAATVATLLGGPAQAHLPDSQKQQTREQGPWEKLGSWSIDSVGKRP